MYKNILLHDLFGKRWGTLKCYFFDFNLPLPDLILGNATTTLDNKLTAEHALAQSGDEYGGAGGYWPHCSIVVKTSSGISFVFHAIDTY